MPAANGGTLQERTSATEMETFHDLVCRHKRSGPRHILVRGGSEPPSALAGPPSAPAGPPEFLLVSGNWSREAVLRAAAHSVPLLWTEVYMQIASDARRAGPFLPPLGVCARTAPPPVSPRMARVAFLLDSRRTERSRTSAARRERTSPPGRRRISARGAAAVAAMRSPASDTGVGARVHPPGGLLTLRVGGRRVRVAAFPLEPQLVKSRGRIAGCGGHLSPSSYLGRPHKYHLGGTSTRVVEQRY
ncbi:unnamed protein product [Lampetra fluviatilis]